MCAPVKPVEHARVDREVGARIKARRKALGHSQTWLGQQIGVSFQQVQKYERGANRVSASVLIAIADALCCKPSLLLDGLGVQDEGLSPALAWAQGPAGEAAYLALHRLTPPALGAVLGTARVLDAMARDAEAAETGRAA